jgi:hypothetical protein
VHAQIEWDTTGWSATDDAPEGAQEGAQEEDMTMEAFLEPKTQLLVALGAAAAAKCQNCFTKLYGSVDTVAASAEEVRAAVAIGMKVAAKSHDFMAAFMDAATGGAVPARPGAEGTAGGCGCP